MALTLTNSDIVSALPLLADMHEKADSGSTTTLEAKTLTSLNDEEIVGASLCILNGSLRGTDITITNYTDSVTGTLTFDAQSSTIANTTIFALVYKQFDSFIERASDIIENDLRKKGYDLDNFLTPAHLKELHLNRTVAHICQSKMQDADTNDTYYVNYQEFMERYNEELNSLVADYDTDEDGVIEDDEDSQSIGQVVLAK